MTAMLERAARAVNDGEAQWSLEPTGTRSEMIARAVLMAVREPDEAVLKVMRDTVPAGGMEWEYLADEAPDCWQAMIDAILSGDA